MHNLIYEQKVGFYKLFKKSFEGENNPSREAAFIKQAFSKSPSPIRSVIDLGGGMGMHAGPISHKGFVMTIYDRSSQALALSKKRYQNVTTIRGSFEKINLSQHYDAAMCLWSTFPYILTNRGRKQFYSWLKTHIRHLIILDEANFYRYLKLKEFHKVYKAVSDQRYTLTLTRDWIITPKAVRESSYVYTVTDRKTGNKQLIQDSEVQQFLSIREQWNLLGRRWRLKGVYGDYNLKEKFNKSTSPRLITVFERKYFPPARKEGLLPVGGDIPLFNSPRHVRR